MTYDLAIVGGGIVGIATALRYIMRQPGSRVLVLEKEPAVALHQTGHNSGVIHAGVYYAPGSLKATLCRRGALLMKEFCRSSGITYEQRGKMIVATDDIEVGRLAELERRAVANGIPFQPVSKQELRQREPLIAGLAALFFPESAIVDYRTVTERMAGQIVENGGEVRLGTAVTDIKETTRSVHVKAGSSWVEARHLLVCGGAQADRLAKLSGLPVNFRVVPFRGEYFQVNPRLREQVNHLIYPVPDPELPFLGVHLTHETEGRISVGPNAVLGMSREGLPRFAFDFNDFKDTIIYPGFWRFLGGNLSSGISELKSSLSKSAYLRSCQKYLPSLTLDDLGERKAGVRAQVIMDDGSISHDFLVLATDRTTHICSAPSPAATSSIAIADYILDNHLPGEKDAAFHDNQGA